jgi:lipopolysaccharide assembly LptE-like protein
MRRSGISVVSGLALLAATACHFPYGFKGGGLPPEIDTMAVLPFENRTAAPTVQQELLEQMRTELRRRLGVRDAPEAEAKSIVRGVILDYQQDIPVAFSTQGTSARRSLQITVDVEIFDVRKGKVLFSRKGLRATGEYAERADAEGRRLAIEKIVNDIVEGAQSQW